VQAVVPKSSSLIGETPANVTFRDTYKAAIVAYQKNGRNVSMHSVLEEGDLLVLQVLEGSPLLRKPPKDFYNKYDQSARSSLFGKTLSASEVSNDDEEADLEEDHGTKLVWKNLMVDFDDDKQINEGDEDTATKGDFLTAFVVPQRSPLENKSLNQLGYTSLPGAVLVSIERPLDSPGATEARFDALSPDEPLRAGDIFWLSGSGESIGDLQKVHGLVFYESEEIKKATASLQDRRLVQAVVAKGSPLVGKTVAESRFRSQYGGAIIAIQRGSDRLHEHPGKVKLHTGDALLIQAGPMFVKQHRGNHETFALITEVENSSPPRPRFFILCVILIAASLAVASLEVRNLLITAAIVGICMVSLGVVTQQEARDCLQWDLYIVVASAFGIGTAMENSGVATGLATFLVRVGTSMGIGGGFVVVGISSIKYCALSLTFFSHSPLIDAGVYGAVFLGTSLLSSILTNNAAAALMYPIAMQTVDQTGTDRLRMAIILMLASSDYMTSFGYQTNLMVYAPGGYKNIDFLKFGGPLQLILWLSGVAIVATGSTWYISWIISGLLFVVVAAVRLTNGAFLKSGKEPVHEKTVGQVHELRVGLVNENPAGQVNEEVEEWHA
jgi:K+/H+ antiporter YhaU regulatory subunit KhtT